MNARRVILVNSNRMRPPVAPLALDYIGGRLSGAGLEVRVVDLSFTDDPAVWLSEVLGDPEPLAVGITFRNTDDCFWPSGAWFVPRLAQVVDQIRSVTRAPIILGGCGFTLLPVPIMNHCGVDLAVVGDGEDALLELVRCLGTGTNYRNVPGVAYRDGEGGIRVNPPRYAPSLDLPTDRSLIDNAAYFRTGGMGNIETKRGCSARCIYCADPLVKGRRSRGRPARQVVDEIASLLHRGIDVLHFCDSEFNIPPEHAAAVCGEIIARGLGDRLRWYTYASVEPFGEELASAMRRAGCVGINFGVDSGCDRMLAALGRSYRRDAIRRAVETCRRAGITVMLDLLLGGPGEDRDSVAETIEFVKSVNPDRAGAALGVRVYPGTRLAEIVAGQGRLRDNPNLRGCTEQNNDFLRPVFFIDHRLGEDPAGFTADRIGDDERFFMPARPQPPGCSPIGDDASNYNYNDNTVLERAIAAGYRGAFWDILRQVAGRRLA